MASRQARVGGVPPALRKRMDPHRSNLLDGDKTLFLLPLGEKVPIHAGCRNLEPCR